MAGSWARGVDPGQAHGSFSFPMDLLLGEGPDSTAGSLSMQREGGGQEELLHQHLSGPAQT